MQPWATHLFMVWVMISPLSSLHVSSCPALKRTAHHFHISLCKDSISLWMALHSTAPGIFHINAGHGVSVDGDVGRDSFVEQLWALFHPNSKLVQAGNAAHFLGEEFGSGLADQPPDDLSDGEGADSAIGFGSRDDSRREICAEDLCWDASSGESPEGFPHAVAWVSVEFGHPSPVLIPSTTRSRGSVGGREFDGEQDLAEEALLVFFSEGKGLCVSSLRLGLRVERGPVSLGSSRVRPQNLRCITRARLAPFLARASLAAIRSPHVKHAALFGYLGMVML